MNTREQRAEAYAGEYPDKPTFYAVKHAHIAGAQEEAAIKDARIAELENAMREILRFKFPDYSKRVDGKVVSVFTIAKKALGMGGG